MKYWRDFVANVVYRWDGEKMESAILPAPRLDELVWQPCIHETEEEINRGYKGTSSEAVRVNERGQKI